MRDFKDVGYSLLMIAAVLLILSPMIVPAVWSQNRRIDKILAAPEVETFSDALRALELEGFTAADLSEEQMEMLHRLDMGQVSANWTELHRGVLTELSFVEMDSFAWGEDFVFLYFKDGKVLIETLQTTRFGLNKTIVFPLEVTLGEIYCVFSVVNEYGRFVHVVKESEVEMVESEE